MYPLSVHQQQVVQLPTDKKIFLMGPAGTGKTTVGIERLRHLLESGLPGQSILILAPQRSLLLRYLDRSIYHKPSSGAQITAVTLSGLGQRMINLFWPQISQQAGFLHPADPPIFLTLETTQYYMAKIVSPLLKEGYFNSIVIDRNRLYSQIIDNLNKSAIIGFSHTEIGERLKAAWTGEPGQLRIYDDAQMCATLFRQYCLNNNLLDFSLQMELFYQLLWSEKLCHNYLINTYRHLIIDNIEEDTPIAHDIFREWCLNSESALLIYDEGAGYRYFLGADPASAYQLKDVCTEQYIFTQSMVSNQEILELNKQITSQLTHAKKSRPNFDYRSAFIHSHHRFFPQMLDWVAAEIAKLIFNDQINPNEIAVFAPFLSDSLRFALTNRLGEYNIRTHSIRPSRSLRDEPPIQCLLTLAAIAHPQWGISRNKYDVAYALMLAIDGLDLVRAQLLTEIVYRSKDGIPTLSSFDQIATDMQARITYRLGERYEKLKNWIQSYIYSPPVDFDYFISQIFGEILSQPGFGFHTHLSMGEGTAIFIDSIKNFKRVVGNLLVDTDIPFGQEFWWMVHDGVISAQYWQYWQNAPDDAVLLAPAHTFLMSNRPVTVQFWLDVGSRSWSERLYQPLTHPFVLSRHWDKNRQWSDMDEVDFNVNYLSKLISGLLLRCREKVYLGLCDFNEQGYEQRGPLLRAIQHILQDFSERD